MAPKTRRSTGSNPGGSGSSGGGSERQRAVSTPVAASETATAEAGPSSGRVYRSGRAAQQQQARFPGRRKVVKKYGRPDPGRSHMQRTLTQIGYAFPPLSDLQELGGLEDDWEGDDRASIDTARDQSLSSIEPTTSAPATRGSKRRKVSQTIKGSPTKSASSSFHTQTLTQFVAKNKGKERDNGDGGDDGDDYGFDATIRDSEDEFSLESPVAKTSASKNLSPDKGPTATPTKPRQNDIGLGSSKAALSTPKAKRTEIPSSQPSPFTPLLLLGRYHSPLGKERSSPLSNKGTRQAIPIPDMDASPSQRKSKFPKRVIPDSFSTTISTSQDKTPLRALSSREIAERSAPQENSELGSTIRASPSISTRDIGRTASATPRLQGPGRSSQEIPDSDDEGDNYAGQQNPGHNAVSTPTPKAGNAAQGGHVINTISSASTSPLSSPSISEPNSPTPLPKTRTKVIGEDSKPNYHESAHERAPIDEDAGNLEEPRSSQGNESQMYSQAVESQRVPLEAIRSLGPQTYESDIIISVHPEQVKKIVSGVKDHEFRGYKIPGTVTRLWIYTTQPVCELRYMASIDPGFLKPGEISNDTGAGNAAFNAGQLVAKFAYKINQVYQLNNPVSLDLMKQNGWVDGPPQRYVFVPPAVVGALMGNLQRALLHQGAEGELSISQEVEAQLLSDMAETQSSQMDRPAAAASLFDVSTTGQLIDSSPPQRVSQNMPPPMTHAQPAQASIPQTPRLGSTASEGARGREDEGGKTSGPASTIWPSQATTATSPATQEEAPLKETAAATTIRESQSQYVSSPIDPAAAVPRPDIDFGQSSISSLRDGMGQPDEIQSSQQSPQLPPMARGPQKRKLRRQGSALRNAHASPNESTQVMLPDSLYEEVRHAPPAVILDSEDSDDGE